MRSNIEQAADLLMRYDATMARMATLSRELDQVNQQHGSLQSGARAIARNRVDAAGYVAAELSTILIDWGLGEQLVDEEGERTGWGLEQYVGLLS